MDTPINTLEIDSILLESGGQFLLSDIYLKCMTGKVTALLGLNGTGKSCLIKIIMSLMNPQSKSIRLNKTPLADSFTAIHYLPQTYFVPGHLTLKTFMMDYKIDVHQFINDFPVFKDKLSCRVRKLSGGLRRLAEVYAIISSASKFALLDEPFTGLTPLHVENIKTLIRQKHKKGFLITDHAYNELIGWADDCYLLKGGKTWPVKNLNDLQRQGYLHSI